MKEFLKKNIKVIICLLVIIGIGIIGYTLAVSQTSSVTIASGNYQLIYNGTATLPSSKLTPVYDSELTNSNNSDKVIKVTFTVKGAQTNPNDIPIIYDVSLTDLNLDNELHSELLKWRLYKNDTQISEGNFSYDFDSQMNNRMVLTNIQQDLPSYSSTADSYTFYIWISEACVGDIANCTEDMDVSNLMNKTLSGNIKVELSTKSKKELVRRTGIQPNSPDLVDGLIPVKYDENKKTWVKADSANTDFSWYDYADKRWANAVLVTESNRNTYQNANEYTEIHMDDILAFYVWIPRYKYKVWNINKEVGIDIYNARTTGIDIVFEHEKNSTGTINCTYNYNVDVSNGGIDLSTTTAETCEGHNGEYYTHPAFTFGNDELNGFWVGKFELTGNTSKLTILPNQTSLRNQTTSSFSTVIQNMQIDSNIYGLSTSRTNTDSHMIKNYEWGAVTYLTHSNYGKCTDKSCSMVTINNCSSYITGIGANNISDSGDFSTCTTTDNKYDGVKGMLASTTGNITGVYDMSGGAIESVMGNGSSSEQSYVFYPVNSGFIIDWYTNNNEKYLTTYARSTEHCTQEGYNKGRLGDATSEVVLIDGNCQKGGWYESSSFFVYGPRAWISRSSNYSASYSNGIFDFSILLTTNDAVSSRAILVSLK